MRAGRSPAIMEVEKVMLIGAVWLPQAHSAVVVSKFIVGNILYKGVKRHPSALLYFNDLLRAHMNTQWH